jgi:hypothetical protein
MFIHPVLKALTSAISTVLLALPSSYFELAQERIAWDAKASELRGSTNQDFMLDCPPNGVVNNNRVYGTDLYTDGSSICSAAIHSGLITALDGGRELSEFGQEQNSTMARSAMM